MSLIIRKDAATSEHVAAIEKLSIEQQLQLAAAGVGDGSLESKLTAAAVATLVARMVQLDEADQADLFACVKDLSTIKNQEDAGDTMKTILEILEPRCSETLVDSESLDEVHPRQCHESWLVWISQKLKSLRDERGWTQEQLAELAGLPQSHISRLESGRHSPSMKTLQKLADALQVDVGTLSLLST